MWQQLSLRQQRNATPPPLCCAPGRIVIELFDDIAPVAVSHFRNRCSEGASDTFKGTVIYKVLREQAMFGGKSTRWVGVVVSVLPGQGTSLQRSVSAELWVGVAPWAYLLGVTAVRALLVLLQCP